jgi:hypothetical protein
MINTQDPGLLGRFVAEDYRHDNATDGREADRQFWTPATIARVPGVASVAPASSRDMGFNRERPLEATR